MPNAAVRANARSRAKSEPAGPTRIQLALLAQHEPAKVLERLRLHERDWLTRLIEAVRAMPGERQ
jgi:hypothetical protein